LKSFQLFCDRPEEQRQMSAFDDIYRRMTGCKDGFKPAWIGI
jgi:hypothetical protein